MAREAESNELLAITWHASTAALSAHFIPSLSQDSARAEYFNKIGRPDARARGSLGLRIVTERSRALWFYTVVRVRCPLIAYSVRSPHARRARRSATHRLPCPLHRKYRQPRRRNRAYCVAAGRGPHARPAHRR